MESATCMPECFCHGWSMHDFDVNSKPVADIHGIVCKGCRLRRENTRKMMKCATILAITALTCTFASGQGQLLVKKTKDFELNGRGDAPEWNTTNWITLEKR